MEGPERAPKPRMSTSPAPAASAPSLMSSRAASSSPKAATAASSPGGTSHLRLARSGVGGRRGAEARGSAAPGEEGPAEDWRM